MGTQINISQVLQPLVEKYAKKRHYATLAQAANELIRIGLDMEEIDVEEKLIG